MKQDLLNTQVALQMRLVISAHWITRNESLGKCDPRTIGLELNQDRRFNLFIARYIESIEKKESGEF